MILASIDLDGTPAENADRIMGGLRAGNGVEPTGDDYRAAMGLLDATRSELAAKAFRADEAARKRKAAQEAETKP
jgi:hypothetical protein